MQRTGWEGELNALVREAAQQSEVDTLLDVHVAAVFRFQYVIDDLNVQRGIAIGVEVCAIESCQLLSLSASRIISGMCSNLVGWRVAGDAEGKEDSLLLHQTVVVNARAGQVTIGEHELLPP